MYTVEDEFGAPLMYHLTQCTVRTFNQSVLMASIGAVAFGDSNTNIILAFPILELFVPNLSS